MLHGRALSSEAAALLPGDAAAALVPLLPCLERGEAEANASAGREGKPASPQSAAIRCNPPQSAAIRRNPPQSAAIRRNPPQSAAVRRSPLQSATDLLSQW